MEKLIRIKGFLAFATMVFLNAFVDLGHKIVIQNTIFKIYDGQAQIILTAVVNALILLPFIFLFSPSGFISDKYPKNKVMRISAWVAVGITGLITLFYYLGLFWPAFIMTFLLAAQSAVYSPAKYGYIKELVGKENIAPANGLIQATTTVAILAGIFVYSVFFEGFLAGVDYSNKSEILKAIAPIGWGLVAISLLEMMLAYTLPQKFETQKQMHFSKKDYFAAGYLRQNLRVIVRHEVIFLSIIGLAIFWSISQVMLAAFPAYAKDMLNITNTVVVQGMMACAGIGIILGSILAGNISKTHIETGLIPIGSLGIAFALMILPSLDNVILQGLNFLAWGVLGGILIIPLNALIQFHASESELGRILAGNNFIQNMTMLAFLGLTVAFALTGIDSLGLFSILTLVALAGTIYTVYKLPQSLLRYIVSFIIGRKYRLNVIGLENMPESGGILMLGNHVSWIDWAIVQMASPRPIHFVMIRNIYERWYLKWFLDIFDVIPISGGASKSALAKVEQYLNNGEVVCLFPEGAISRTGHLGEFQRGYEKAAQEAKAVILPFYLHGLWGSWFSRSSEKLKTLRSTGNKMDIIVAFGKVLPADTKAEELKKQVFELSVDTWNVYTGTLSTIPLSWMVTAKRMKTELAVTDAVGDPLTNNRLLTAAICFSRLIAKTCREQNAGLLLPTSSAGMIANLAVLLRGKTIINLNYTTSAEALRAAIAGAEIKTIYTSRRFLERLEKKGFDLENISQGTSLYYMEDLNREISRGARIFTLLLVRLLPAWFLQKLFCKKVDIQSPAAILFSSGSEGRPKGIVLSHRNIMGNLKQISDVLNTDNQDIVMACLPLFHAFGLTVTTFMPLVEGLPVICHPDPTDVVNVAKAIAKYRATIFCGTSTFLRLFAKNSRVHPLMLESLRIVVAGAEKLNQDVREAFKLKFNKEIYEGYGATETTPVASVNIPDCIDINYWKIQLGTKPGTVGMPLPGTSFRIVDPASLEQLPTGEDGLILIGGTQLMLGYLNDEEKTREAIVEIDGKRWYKTGDKGHLDQDGFLTIVDRYSRFAKLGGEMISLTAVEEQVRTALKQQDLELAAINLPDEKKGEKIVLLSSEQLEANTLRQAMLETNCNPLMIPSEVIVTDAIPKLGSGKTDYKTAKSRILENLNASPAAV